MVAKYRELVQKENEARQKAEAERQRQRREALFYKNSNRIPLLNDVVSGMPYSLSKEKFLEDAIMPVNAANERFCIGYRDGELLQQLLYWGCVADNTFKYQTNRSAQEAYAFSVVRWFDDVTLDDVIGAVEKKYPGLKRTDEKVPVKSIIRGTVYLAVYNLPQIVLENDKMRVIIQQLNAASLTEVKVERIQTDDLLYRMALKDGETYLMDANTAGNLYQATKDNQFLHAAGTKINDPTGTSFVESKRSAAGLAAQLKKYGCAKDLYVKSNNAYFKEYADKFAGVELSPMFDLPMTPENKMFLRNEMFLSTCIKDVEKKQSTFSNALDNAFSQAFGLTKGGKSKFVMVVYDKAMWEPVKQYYNGYLQKLKQKEQEAKQKKLSL